MDSSSDFPRFAGAADVESACAGLVDDLHLGRDLPSVYLLMDGRLRCQASRGYFQVADFTPWTGVIGRTVTSGRPVVLADVARDPDFIAAVPGLRAEACFPVRLHGEVVGAVNLESTEELTAATLARVEAAADVLGRRLAGLGGLPVSSLPERLARIAVTMTSLTDLDDVRVQATEAVRLLSGAGGAAVAARDARGRWSVVHADGPLAPVLRSWDDDVLGFLSGWVWAGASSYFPDGEAVPAGYHFLGESVRSVLVHPLVVAGQVTGLLLTADGTDRAHDPQLNTALELLASLTAGAQVMVETMARLREQATTDPLTGLTNRRGLVDALAARVASPEGVGAALVLLDLDGFKSVNDRFGHAAGDEVLQAVAGALLAGSAADDLVCRLGGDEFAVLAHGVGSLDDAAEVGERLAAAASAAGHSSGRWSVTASAGVRVVGGVWPDAVLVDADAALLVAKRAGPGRTRLWDAELQARTADAAALVEDLAAAMAADDGALRLAYQPLVELTTARVHGIEALVRWQHPVRGPVPAMEIVACAEQSGLMPELTRWVLRTAFAAAVSWPAKQQGRPVNIGVNISAAVLSDEAVVFDVRAALAEAGLSADCVVLEVTETAQVTNLERAATVLTALSRLGVGLALDDFGTGYSSLTHVHALPFDILKIDRSFVAAAARGDVRAVATVTAVCALAARLDVDVVAEGVEDLDQPAERIRLGCGYAQGYAYAHPMSGEQVRAALDAAPPAGWQLSTRSLPSGAARAQ